MSGSHQGPTGTPARTSTSVNRHPRRSARAMASLFRRVWGVLRQPRYRNTIILIGGWQAYNSISNNAILLKIFSASRHRPGETVLDLDLGALQVVNSESLSPFQAAEQITVQRLVSALAAAKSDARVTGLVVRGVSGLSGIGLAEVTELRHAIQDFSKGWGGKPSLLHVPEGFSGLSNGTVPMYFASGFDSFNIQPTSAVIVPGLSLATLFFKNLLDNVGVRAKKVARKEFKTAANSLTEEKFTDAHRESSEALLDAIMNTLVNGIAEGRKLSREQVLSAIDSGVMMAEEAQKAGLVDGLVYRDELPQVMRKHLKEASKAREKLREEAEDEWRAAMPALQATWIENGGAAETWGSGELIMDSTAIKTAAPLAASFGDPRNEKSKTATEAEIRALKAHLRWLETCPWESLPAGEAGDGSVFRSLPSISLTLELERRLCEEGIKALETCPPLVENFHKARESGDRPDEKAVKSFIRWLRSMWRSKCLIARIVGNLNESCPAVPRPELRENASTEEKEGNGSAAVVSGSEYAPRVFLTGYAGDYDEPSAKRLADAIENVESIEPASESTLTALSGTEDDTSGSGPSNGGENAESLERQLHHLRFRDYIELINSESRAAAYKLSWGPAGQRDNRERQHGSIDANEKNALVRLQLPGYMFHPWRLNTMTTTPIVAVITIQGAIADSNADVARAAIRRADKDPRILAIVLRVESPGGSATASDLISRAVEVTKKPVVASMGSICASGGYFISAPADKVFASAMTITGSIGVIFQTLNTAGLFERVGITADSVERGRFAKYFGDAGIITEWSEDFSNRIDALIDTMYNDFVNVVARGRGIPFDEAERIAHGRVWAGSDAVGLGLVDELGGLEDAIRAAAEMGGAPPDAPPRAIAFPTKAMMLDDRLRRAGILPSKLDEEGDEAPPSKKKRRPWFRQRRISGASDGNAASDSSESLPGISSILSRVLRTGTQSFDSDLNAMQYVVKCTLAAVDSYLLQRERPMWVKSLLGAGLDAMARSLDGGRTAAAIAEEIEMTQATAGRPAAAAPNMRIEK